MTLLQKLKEQGWHLTEDGLRKLISELQTEDVKKIIASALNWDLKDIAAGGLPAKPESNGFINGRLVLQLQKMRNISASKANEESTAAPRFLQLELSDGLNVIPALELERIPNLSLNVPPGTKIYFNSDKLQMIQGFLVLKASEVQVLGGRVENLVEKWELARQLSKYAKSNRRLSGAGAPPPWIAFEKRMDAHKESLPLDRNFKSLQAVSDKDKNSKENDEFNASRNQAIADAAKAGKKKIFGGGQQNMLDHNLKKILEKGYSEDDAAYALRATNNNLEKALFSLKKRNNKVTMDGSTKPTAVVAPEVRGGGGGGGGPRGRGAATAKEEASASKPQANVSLYEFLNAKIPLSTPSSYNQTSAPPKSTALVANTPATKIGKDTKHPYRSNDIASSSSSSNNNKDSKTSGGKFENNMSSSFNANHTSKSDDRADRNSQQPSQSQRHQNYNQRDERINRNNPMKKRGDERPRTNMEKPVNAYENSITQTGGSITNASASNKNMSVPGSSYNSNNNRRNDRIERGPRKDRDQAPRQSIATGPGGYQGNKRNQDYKPNENKNFQQKRDNNNSRATNDYKNSNNYQQSQQSSNNTFDANMDKLTESTSKMSLNSKRESSYTQGSQGRGRRQGGSTRNSSQTGQHAKSNNSQQQTPQFISSQNFTNKSQAASKQTTVPSNVTNPPQQQQQQQQQQQTSHTFVTQLSNGYSYDPNKIIGFQSKEANEYAMNLLKSQGLLPQQTGGSATGQANITPTGHQQQIISSNHPNAPQTAVAYMPQNPNVFVATPQPPMAQYGMMPTGSWPWNIGDLCLAKYWEDGNYYDAKITAISENTCVVLFMGYGNYEEVLKADCLPITDAANHPLNPFQNGPPPQLPGPMQQQMAHSYQGPNTPGGGVSGTVTGGGGGGGAAGGNQRYRTERQMYVPPPKRVNQNNNN